MSIMPIRPIGCRCMAQDDPAWHNKECWIRQTDALRQQFAELQEWQRIIIGTGTDQEAVIRLAAMEYTKIAVQCWKDKVTSLEQQLASATYRLNVLEPEYTACQARAAAAERTRYGLENAVARYGQQIVDLEQQIAQVIAERNAAETRNENYRLKLNASDSVIAQLSEHLADDQAEIAWLQEKP